MTLKEQVTSLDLSKQLRERGIRQDSFWYWIQSNTEDWHLVHEPPEQCRRYAAFTPPELKRWLPAEIVIKKKQYDKRYNKFTSLYLSGINTWYVYYASTQYNRMTRAFQAETEADAVAKMLIYLLEKKLITL